MDRLPHWFKKFGTTSLLCLLLASMVGSRPTPVAATGGVEFAQDATSYTLTRRNGQMQITYKMHIRKSDFGFTLFKADGVSTYVNAIPATLGSGLCFSAPNESSTESPDVPGVTATTWYTTGPTAVQFRVTNAYGTMALVTVDTADWFVNIAVDPDGPAKATHSVCARTAAMGPMYGLGDHGGYPVNYRPDDPPATQTTQFGLNQTNKAGICDLDFRAWTTNHRFISNFAIFPAQRFAQVFFYDGKKHVCNSGGVNELRVVEAVDKTSNLYYFMGDVAGIYANYKDIRRSLGYGDAKPQSRMFEVGFESWGALGWNTYQASLTTTINAYLTDGYRVRWGVVGSGFWKGERRAPTDGGPTNTDFRYQGNTTSFGLWDTACEDYGSPPCPSSRRDGLPNPRYPDPPALKNLFASNDMKLILGMRINFMAISRTLALTEQTPPYSTGNGFYNLENNGPFPPEGLANGYYLKNPNGTAKRFSVIFPYGDVWMLDGTNPAAREWYMAGLNLWGVDGIKEDTMLEDGFNPATGRYSVPQTHPDSFLNDVQERVSAETSKDYIVMVRNSAYSVAGDVLRLDDANFEGENPRHANKDRVPINMLNFAASGAPNVYADTVGGNGTQISYPTTDINLLLRRRTFLLRHALLSTVTPVMSMGIRPQQVDPNDTVLPGRVKAAAIWHAKFAPYIHSAAVDSYTTGYPHTFTPLPIAYPDDSATHDMASAASAKRQYQWMLGPSMMAIPIYGEDAVPSAEGVTPVTSRNVYLPAGRWIDFSTGTEYQGPYTLVNYPHALDTTRIPVMIGGKGIVVFRTADHLADPSTLANTGLVARVYTIKGDASYTFTYPDGTSTSTITNNFALPAIGTTWTCPKVRDISVTPNVEVTRTCSLTANRHVQFSIVAGHNYTVSDQ